MSKPHLKRFDGSGGEFSCTVSSFGGDPLIGIRKFCYCYEE
jgi:hypothetical protein